MSPDDVPIQTIDEVAFHILLREAHRLATQLRRELRREVVHELLHVLLLLLKGMHLSTDEFPESSLALFLFRRGHDGAIAARGSFARCRAMGYNFNFGLSCVIDLG